MCESDTVIQGATVSLDVTTCWKLLRGLLLLLGVGRLFFCFSVRGLQGVTAHLAPALPWKQDEWRG